MRRPQLDLSILHHQDTARTLREGAAKRFGSSTSGVIFSRRDLLKLTGVAAIGCSQGLSVFGAALQGPLDFLVQEGRASFKIGGRERWVIDTRRFGGKPILTTAREENLIRLELVNARYPGTELSADMFCEIRRQESLWQMKLRLSLGGFSGEAPFEAWLIGLQTAASVVSLDYHVNIPGGSREMLMKGKAQAEFSPDWMLKLAGDGICRVKGFGGEIVSDVLALSLLEPDDACLTIHRDAKRTLISLKRGERSWPIEPLPNATDGWKVLATNSSFDMLHLETGESEDGSAGAQALLAESSVEGATLAFCPSAYLMGRDGKLFALPLRNARYAVALDAQVEQSALVARFAHEPVWLQHKGLGVGLGDADETEHFELVCVDGKMESLHCAPAILSAASSLPGAIVEHAPPAKSAHLSFNTGPIERAQAHHAAGKNTVPHGELRIDAKVANHPHISLSLLLESISVLRPDDMLSLTFEFVNLSLVESIGEPQHKGLAIKKTKPNLNAFISVRFPPQHIMEEAYEETDLALASPVRPRGFPAFLAAHFQQGTQLKDPAKFPARARMSGESRLIFSVPDTVTSIPYTLKSLLDWDHLVPQLSPNALLPPPPPPELNIKEIPLVLLQDPPAPQGNQFFTLIEAPTKLWLTPHEAAAWAHARDAITHNGRTELWHTRLGVKGKDGLLEAAGVEDAVDEHNDYYRTLRAVFALDGDPFKVSLSGKNRLQLMTLTSDFKFAGCRERVIRAERLMLTSLGAWMNVAYAAEPPKGFDLEEWRHRMTMGREHYVRVVTKGYLFPFGHRASLITITERKFRAIPGNPAAGDAQKGEVGAFLLQRRFIIVRQPLKLYGETSVTAKDAGKDGGFGDASMPFKGNELVHRLLPFRSVRLTTLVTPDLKEPSNKEVLKTIQGEQPFLFHIIAEDKDGQLIDFTAPLMFAPAAEPNSAFNVPAMLDAAHTYANLDQSLRQRPLQGQRVGFAPNAGSPAPNSSAGATSFETETITFDAFVYHRDKNIELVEPAFVPVMARSVIRVQAIEQLAGNNERPSVRFHPAYLEHEFMAGQNQNPGELFFELASNKIILDFSGKADKAGGLATPCINIDGLSRKFGAVGDSNKLASGTFDAATFFDPGKAKILGGISLKDIIQTLKLDQSNAASVPRMANTIVRDQNGVPLENRTELSWNPLVTQDPKNLFVPVDAANTLSLNAKMVTPLGASKGSGEPPYYVNGLLQNFAINFFDLLIVNFAKLELTMQSGKKMDVSAALKETGAVTFGGPLAFLNVLAAIIPSTGFSDPPGIDVTASGVSVGYSIGLPTISAGAWGIKDLSIGATLTIPFTGDNQTRLRFNFSERHNPFQVSAYGVTGGVFLALHIGLGGIEMVEASVELGGSLSLNLGVASGAVFIMIGIHLTMVMGPPTQVSLGGYVRLGGAVSVLGLITVSVEFYMELAYLFPPQNKVRGEASLTVKVKVLFFSKKVTLSVVREMDAPSTPITARLLDQPPSLESAHLSSETAWERYCDAFA